MMKKPRIAVVGAGQWGKNLVRVFNELEVLSIVCDRDVERLNDVRNKIPRMHTTSRFEDVLNDESIDAVVIATNACSHYPLAQKALWYNKDVFVEKPLAMNSWDGFALCELARKRERVLMVGHILEYHPAALKLRELINKGVLGKIQYIYSNRLNFGTVRREENILWSFAPHDISLIIMFLSELPQVVSAQGGNFLHPEIADVTVTSLQFLSGVKAHIHVSWLHPYKEQKLIIIGDRAMAEFNDLEEDKLKLYEQGVQWQKMMPLTRRADARPVPCDQVEPLRCECAHFVDAVLNRSTPQSDGMSGVRVLDVLMASQKSLEQKGQPVRVVRTSAGETGASNDFFLHESAVIDQPAVVGRGSRIWHFSHIMAESELGKECVVGQNVFIADHVRIGDRVKIQNNVSVYRGVTVEDDVFLGPSMVFTNVLNPRAHVERKEEFLSTLVKKGATIGANATVVCGITIGRFAMVGAGSVVTHDIPDFGLVYGVPAELKGFVCQCGEKLSFKPTSTNPINTVNGVCDRCGLEYVQKFSVDGNPHVILTNNTQRKKL